MKFLLLIGLSFSVSSIFALNKADLYSGSIPVKDQSLATRKAALPDALAQVLVKVSGNSAVATIPRIKGSLSHADSLLLSYTYKKNPRHSSKDNKPYLLIANFNEKEVIKLLNKSHQAIWGSNRPLLLIWLAKQNNHQASLLSHETNPDVFETIIMNANSRGLPLAFPLLDLTDLNTLSAQDIVNNNEVNIIKASQRYPHAGIATLIMTETPDSTWQSNLTLELNGEQQQFNASGQDEKQVIADTVNQLADGLAEHYSVLHSTHGSGHTYQLQVYGVKDVDDFARANHYLKQLAPVKAVSINEILPKQIIFSLTVSGDINALKQAISLDNTLMPYQASDIKTDNNALIYRISS